MMPEAQRQEALKGKVAQELAQLTPQEIHSFKQIQPTPDDLRKKKKKEITSGLNVSQKAQFQNLKPSQQEALTNYATQKALAKMDP